MRPIAIPGFHLSEMLRCNQPLSGIIGMKETRDGSSLLFTYIVISEGNAPIVSIQLYVAGSETTSTALRWALLYMCLNPDMQRRAQAEIDQLIG